MNINLIPNVILTGIFDFPVGVKLFRRIFNVYTENSGNMSEKDTDISSG